MRMLTAKESLNAETQSSGLLSVGSPCTGSLVQLSHLQHYWRVVKTKMCPRTYTLLHTQQDNTGKQTSNFYPVILS